MKALTAGLFLLLLAGCSLGVKVTSYRTLEPRPVEKVEVFTEAPPTWRPYEEIGTIEVDRAETGASFTDMVQRARLEAARIGADAIVVRRGGPERSTIERHLWITPIVWKPAP